MTGKGVIFDMDGVLVDSYRAHFASWCRMGAERGVETGSGTGRPAVDR